MSQSDLEQKRQELSRAIIQTVISDPTFRDQLLIDEKAALESSGLWDQYAEVHESEVTGYVIAPGGDTFTACCITY